MKDRAAQLAAAMAHQEARRFDAAEPIYRELIARDPRDVDALQLLGYLMLQTERPAEAVPLYQRALRRAAQPAFRLYLGEALLLTDRVDEALPHLAAAVAALPRHPEPHFFYGLACRRRGDAPAALAAFRAAIACDPGNREHIDFLAKLLTTTGRHEEGVEVFRELLAEYPDSAPLHYALGSSLCCLGREAEAEPHLQRAVDGGCAIAEAHDLLGRCARAAQRWTEAARHFQRAVQLKPDFVAAMNNLALVLAEADRLNEAVAVQCHALKIDPNYIPSTNNLAGCLMRQGRVREAAQFHRRATELAPGNPAFHSNLLLSLNYDGELSPAALAAEHAAYQRRLDTHSRLPASPLATPLPGPGERVRVGFVSADLRSHSVAFWIEPLLAHLDRDRVELHAFYNYGKSDGVTERLRRHFEHWHDLAGLDPAVALAALRAAAPHVLIDLSGHTAHNLLPALHRRAAPVQISFLGYPNTTGLTAMDFRLTDAVADPAGRTERWHVEQLLRFARTAWCYQPPPQSPAPRRTATGGPVFGCFNNLAKIQPPVLAQWSRLLQRVSGSTLYLKSAGLQDPFLRRRFVEAFAAHGIGEVRIRLEGRRARVDNHLECYGEVDVALDTFPYHGTTTTAEALWMGVPVVTLAGADHRSRVGASLLTSIGRPEWVAGNWDDYVERAAVLASDPAGTPTAARLAVREQLRTSPLMDAPAYAADFLRLLDEALAGVAASHAEPLAAAVAGTSA
jgi:protein O-GlcNAc transferase